jgi:putative tryptophan/tyrosine transport system substrate-binding protein
MRRREFIAGLAAVWPLSARAQQGARIGRVGVLMHAAATDPEYQSFLAAFIQGLRQLGWIEGQNLRVEARWNAGNAGLAQIYAAQLIEPMPDVILAASTTNLTAIRQATSTVSVVFVSVSDPVAQGFVTSVRQPGGNITGFSGYDFSIGGKWLGLLMGAAPGLARVAVMFNPDRSPQSKFFVQAIEAAGAPLGVQAIADVWRSKRCHDPVTIFPVGNQGPNADDRVVDVTWETCLPSLREPRHRSCRGAARYSCRAISRSALANRVSSCFL